MIDMSKPVVIIGSGFSGSSTAFHLAKMGIKTIVLERNERLGGYFPTLEMQFPTNSCGVCFMNPDYPSFCPYIELEREENIEAITKVDIKQIKSLDNGYKVIYECERGVFEVEAGAVVLSSGYDTFDIKNKPELGGGFYENVLPALEMEKLIYKLRAGLEAFDYKKIAYIQCVGSRDLRINRPYCSSFCCMFAVKQAMLLKELKPELDIAIFYMDLRAFGKDYERYYNEAKALGIRFVRSAVASVKKRPATGKLEVLYTKDGSAYEESFDMVVLSQGADFRKTTEKILKDLNINFDYYLETPFKNREVLPNLFITGTAFEPMDIPDSVIDGAYTAALLSERYDFKAKEAVPVKVKYQKAKNIGIAGINIPAESYNLLKDEFEGVVNLKNLEELQFFVKENNLDALCLIVEDIRFYEGQLLQKENFGIHRDSIYLVPLRSYNLVEEIRSALSRIKAVQRHNYSLKKLNQRVLVVGGGLAGIVAALRLSRLGLSVVIVEKEEELGGRIKDLPTRKELISELIQTIEREGKIEILKGFKPTAFRGRFGEFKVTLESSTEKRVIDCGAVIIATGGIIRKNIYPFEDNNRVFTFFDFEKRFDELLGGKNVVMLQCAGSRTEDNPVCYRVCCTKAIEGAIKLKESNPNLSLFIIHKDIRTYGYRENLYRKARSLGINFIRMAKDPEIIKEGNAVHVKVSEEGTNNKFDIGADYLLLSTGIDPETSEAKDLFGLDLQDGFITPYNKKAALMDIKPGIYGTGLCLNPLYSEDIIKQSEAVAIRVAVKLLKKEVVKRFNTAFVNHKYCCGCELCVKACPVSARYISEEEKIALVDETLCEGCGTCAMVCTNKASQHKLYEHKSMLKTIDYYL